MRTGAETRAGGFGLVRVGCSAGSELARVAAPKGPYGTLEGVPGGALDQPQQPLAGATATRRIVGNSHFFA